MQDLGIGIGHAATGGTLIDWLGANACQRAACNRVLDNERHVHVRLPESRDHPGRTPRGRPDGKRRSLDPVDPATHLVVDPTGVGDEHEKFAIPLRFGMSVTTMIACVLFGDFPRRTIEESIP